MTLGKLPTEILLLLAFYVDSEADLFFLAQIHPHWYETLIHCFYRRNPQCYNGSALYAAAQKGNILAFKRSLLAWTDVTQSPELPIRGQYTPLFTAAHHGHRERTALYGASIRGHIHVVEALVAHEQIDVDAYDSDGYTPISVAARNGHVEVVKMLLARGANPGLVRRKNSQVTTLHSAVERQKPELVRLLVNRENVDPNALHAKSTPLELAVDRNNEELVETLLTDPRVDPDLTGHCNVQKLLLRATLRINAAIVRMLLATRGNNVYKDQTGFPPAMLLEVSAEARENLIRERRWPGSKSLSGPENTVELINARESLSQLLSQIEILDSYI
ncbi:ankyrin [Penicillium maclennaniae]|uniref:ankyrin n=1 Tax=Penicillium maclennaniae TaxID=1343394 RepID=UPI0025415A5E|nr:ankyrin [Penicillium maclennaniae]KAJ5681606.1 ankyrin [Penicillium maclennaniae]